MGTIVTISFHALEIFVWVYSFYAFIDTDAPVWVLERKRMTICGGGGALRVQTRVAAEGMAVEIWELLIGTDRHIKHIAIAGSACMSVFGLLVRSDFEPNRE